MSAWPIDTSARCGRCPEQRQVVQVEVVARVDAQAECVCPLRPPRRNARSWRARPPRRPRRRARTARCRARRGRRRPLAAHSHGLERRDRRTRSRGCRPREAGRPRAPSSAGAVDGGQPAWLVISPARPARACTGPASPRATRSISSGRGSPSMLNSARRAADAGAGRRSACDLEDVAAPDVPLVGAVMHGDAIARPRRDTRPPRRAHSAPAAARVAQRRDLVDVDRESPGNRCIARTSVNLNSTRGCPARRRRFPRPSPGRWPGSVPRS